MIFRTGSEDINRMHTCTNYLLHTLCHLSLTNSKYSNFIFPYLLPLPPPLRLPLMLFLFDSTSLFSSILCPYHRHILLLYLLILIYASYPLRSFRPVFCLLLCFLFEYQLHSIAATHSRRSPPALFILVQICGSLKQEATEKINCACHVFV